jgi:hypothetical protein
LFLQEVYAGQLMAEKHLFIIISIDLLLLAIISLPWLTKKAENFSNEKFQVFLDLPERDSKFTFTAISGFLSDQALTSFLVTVLIFTGKQVLESYGGVIAAVYVFSLFLAAITVGVVSLIRFVVRFTKHHVSVYILATLISTVVMFAFFNFGLKMAT